jgi:uncharacterized protein
MMFSPIGFQAYAAITLGVTVVNVVASRVAVPEVWASRNQRRVLLLGLGLPWVALLAWISGQPDLAAHGSRAAALSLPVIALFMLTLVLIAFARTLVRIVDALTTRLRRCWRARWGARKSTAEAAPPPAEAALPPALPLVSRRKFSASLAAALPVASVGVGATMGFTGMEDPVQSRQIDIRVPRLASVFDGMCILHLSDLHLGCTRNVKDLERFLRDLPQRPDLIALTGDVAERLEQLGPALSLLEQVRARHGVYACLGNHEYFYDLHEVRTTFDASATKLLVDSSERIRIGDRALSILGVNDPHEAGGFLGTGLDERIERLVTKASPADFRLLLSHRPRGFRAASARGVDLTLSGHLHGGQVGAAQVSALDLAPKYFFPWGVYKEGQSQLYTTSGFGDWYPFRLGCPPEGALLTLRRA